MIRVKNVSQQRAQSCFHLASWYFWNVYPSLSGLLWDSQKELTDCFFFFYAWRGSSVSLCGICVISEWHTECTRKKKKKRYQPEAELKSRSLVSLREARLPITEVKSLITQNTRIRLSLSLFLGCRSLITAPLWSETTSRPSIWLANRGGWPEPPFFRCRTCLLPTYVKHACKSPVSLLPSCRLLCFFFGLFLL